MSPVKRTHSEVSLSPDPEVTKVRKVDLDYVDEHVDGVDSVGNIFLVPQQPEDKEHVCGATHWGQGVTYPVGTL